MKYAALTILIGIWGCYYSLYAQTTTDDQFAYHYGVLMGHDWEQLHLPQDITSASVMVEAMRDIAKGTYKISRADALKAIENHNVNQTGADEQYDLSYCHGVVIGSDWERLGIPIKELTLGAFIEGIEAVIRPSSPVVSREEAQQIVTQRYANWHQQQANQKIEENKAFFTENKQRQGVKTLSNGIQYEILQRGKGPKIGNTKARIQLYQTCTLVGGKEIERVQPPDGPMTVTLNGVLSGWKEILPLMRKNETIRVYLPPKYGYGAQQHGKVPPNSILIYELTVVGVLD